ncbi:MAG: hypothetical protein K0R10_521 [Alphaproteobacteria bacterium]|jgi:hypothetical protein|nr:hypothetical protein [Alphaproteobacteria bacterium]
MESTRQKFWEAADLLSTGDCPLQIRLRTAAEHLRSVDASKIPAPLRADFEKIQSLTEAEAEHLTRDEAEALASAIFHIYAEVHEGM